MNPTSIACSIVPEAKGGPFVLWDPLPLACRKAKALGYDAIVKLMQEGKINTRPWVTHRTTFERYIADFPEATKPEAGMIKLMVEVTE